MITKGYAAKQPGGKLEVFEYDLGLLGDHQVDVKVDYCGLCYSDVSMIDNHWGMTQYPLYQGMKLLEQWKPWVPM